MKFVGAAVLGVVGLASAATQGVFAHYLVGGISADEAATDVKDAQSIGLDAFALNVGSLDPFATDPSYGAIPLLFQAAQANNFSLFFSFDILQLDQVDPQSFLALVKQYQDSTAYYKRDGRPFVSTFRGALKTYGQADANSGWQTAFQNAGVDPFFVPDFDDFGGYPSGIVDAFPFADGFFSWESAWPAGDSPANVSADTDLGVQSQTQAAGKVYMMPWSSVQFKDLDASNFYYRSGELNYGQRIEQLLTTQPDYVELITWNDAPESHYIGNWWDEQVGNSSARAYFQDFDHKGWQQLVPAVVAALKNGATDPSTLYPSGVFSSKAAAGAMWYHPVLTTTQCGSGQPSGAGQALDVVNYAFSLPAGATGYTVTVSSGGNQIGSFPAQAGLNINSVQGLVAGQAPRVDISSGGQPVASAVGDKDVQSQADLCNLNYVVVGF